MKIKRSRSLIYILAVLAAGAAILVDTGCRRRTSVQTVAENATEAVKDTASKIGDMAANAWNSVKDATFDQRASLSTSLGKAADGMQSTANEWGSKISSLSGDSRTSAQSALNDFNSAIRDLKSRLGDVSGASSGTWENVKSGISTAWQKAQSAYTRLQASFKSQ